MVDSSTTKYYLYIGIDAGNIAKFTYHLSTTPLRSMSFESLGRRYVACCKYEFANNKFIPLLRSYRPQKFKDLQDYVVKNLHPVKSHNYTKFEIEREIKKPPKLNVNSCVFIIHDAKEKYYHTIDLAAN